MLGLEIKIVSETKESLLLCLQRVIKEIEHGSVNMYIPLNDIDKTEADFSLCHTAKLGLYDNWDECCSVEHMADIGTDKTCAVTHSTH